MVSSDQCQFMEARSSFSVPPPPPRLLQYQEASIVVLPRSSQPIKLQLGPKRSTDIKDRRPPIFNPLRYQLSIHHSWRKIPRIKPGASSLSHCNKGFLHVPVAHRANIVCMRLLRHPPTDRRGRMPVQYYPTETCSMAVDSSRESHPLLDWHPDPGKVVIIRSLSVSDLPCLSWIQRSIFAQLPLTIRHWRGSFLIYDLNCVGSPGFPLT